MPLFLCHIRVHESVSRSMACAVLATDPLESPFLTFPAPDFAVILDSTQEHTGTDRASKTLHSSGNTSDSGKHVPGALFSNAPMSSYNDLETATTMFNFLPVTWSKKEHYSAAVTGLQQLVLPSPAAYFTSLTTPSASAPSSSSSKFSPSRNASWNEYADSQECSSHSDEIAMGVSEYFDCLKGSGWDVPSSTIARLAVSLHSAALAHHAYLQCMGNDNDYNENNDDDDDDGDNDDDDNYDDDIDRDRDRDSESRSWKRISSYGGPPMSSRSKRKLLHNKNKTKYKNKNKSQKQLSELSRTFSSILRAHLEYCRPLGSVFLFLTGGPSEEQNINGFTLSNYSISMESSALELKLLHGGSCDDVERSGRKRRNSDQSIHSSGSARGYSASGAGDDDDDMSEAELLFILSNGKDKNRNRNESAHKRQKEQVQGEQVALENGEEEVDEEKNDTHPALSLHGVLGSLDEELNAADRLKHSLESVLSSTGINSSNNLHSPLLRSARELSMNSKFPPKPIDGVELFLSKCREEKSKFQNLSKLASSIIYPNIMQE